MNKLFIFIFFISFFCLFQSIDCADFRNIDEPVFDNRFSFRKDYDTSFQIYKKIDQAVFIIKNILTTKTVLILFEDVYDVSFNLYEGFIVSFFRSLFVGGASYRFIGLIMENFVPLMDFFHFSIFVLLFIITPVTITTSGYGGLCAVVMLLTIAQIFFWFKLPKLRALLSPSIVLFIISFALLITRGNKTSSDETESSSINFMCIDAPSFRDYLRFEKCDDHDKVYIWFIFLFIYIANFISIFVYIRGVRYELPYFMENNFYLYVLKKLRENHVCLTIRHIKRSPASNRYRLPFWSSDISEYIETTTVFVTLETVKLILDDIVEGCESGKIKWRDFKIGRESDVLVNYMKGLAKLKQRILNNE